MTKNRSGVMKDIRARMPVRAEVGKPEYLMPLLRWLAYDGYLLETGEENIEWLGLLRK